MPKERYKGDIDISAVGSAPPVTVARSTDHRFMELVAQSWDLVKSGSQEPSVALTVNDPALASVESKFRTAARHLSTTRKENIGVTIQVYPHGHPEATRAGVPKGFSRMHVQARPGKVRGPRAPKDGTVSPAAEAPTTVRPARKSA